MSDRTMPDAHPLRSGDPTRLGAYEILGRLGEGGQGAVFLGRPADGDGAAGSPERAHVAIKLLHAGLTGDEAARARFVRELEVAKRVARFCTAQVLDADVEGDQPYIVGEYVPGQSLHRLVQAEGPRTAGALERLAISTLTALIAIHQAGIVHRDFKPHNVMMGPDGPRVIDFGVARALNAVGETQNVGTPAYMAPEHFTGGEVGPAADMFAWGTTMVFAANGRPAFGNDDMAAVMHRILTGEPDLGDLTDPLRGLVLACLAKEPHLRPSAREAQERLVNAATGIAPAAPAPAPGPPPPFPGTFPPAPAPLPEAPAQTSGTAPYSLHGATVPHESAPPHGATDPHASAPPHGIAVPQPHPVHGHTAPQPPAPTAPRRGRLVPVAAAVAVLSVLGGGAVWAATARSGGDDKAGQRENAAPAGQAGSGDSMNGQAQGNGSKDPKKQQQQQQRQQDKQKQQQQQKGQGGGKNPQGENKNPNKGQNGGAPSNNTGGGGGVPPAQEPANKYTPQAACNTGGKGSGYYVQRSVAGSGGTAYLLYNGTYNCAVTMKTANVGKRSPVSVWIQKQGGGQIGDSGSFEWYAGPVFVSARKTCVRFGGNGAAAPYGNCG
ncbi:serine/threonine protein kinase [Spirillospora sp. NPDC127200]